MPVAGNNPRARANAHLRWAERYHSEGRSAKAMAHFGRGLDYESMLRFGTNEPSASEFVEFISFVPNREQLGTLLARGVEVRGWLDKYRSDKDERGGELLKSLGKPDKKGEYPPEITLPHDTILSKMATKLRAGGPNPTAKDIGGLKMAVCVPRSTPYIGENMGPLISIAVSKDDPVINLFHLSENFVHDAADAGRKFAQESEITIISALRYMCTVAETISDAHLTEAVAIAEGMERSIGLDASKHEVLVASIVDKGAKADEKSARKDLHNTMKMLLCVEACIRGGQRLSEMGLALDLFFQTWDVDTGSPNFSVPSPHFQTCLAITNKELLHEQMKKKGMTEEQISPLTLSFECLATMLRSSMSNYAKKFVRVSALKRR